jgi:hypothetical protein
VQQVGADGVQVLVGKDAERDREEKIEAEAEEQFFPDLHVALL